MTTRCPLSTPTPTERGLWVLSGTSLATPSPPCEALLFNFDVCGKFQVRPSLSAEPPLGLLLFPPGQPCEDDGEHAWRRCTDPPIPVCAVDHRKPTSVSGVPAITRALAEGWKALNEDDRASYETESSKDQKRFRVRLSLSTHVHSILEAPF